MSRRLALLNFVLRYAARPFLKRTKSPEKARRDFALTARLIFRGPKTHSTRREIGGVSSIEIAPPGTAAEGVMLYFHGGGYITGSAATHLPMVGALARMAGLRAVLPDYRLAPESPFPAAFDDARAVWQGLLSEGVAPDRILLGGDSAGGGLALALLGDVLRREEQPPAGLFAFSPWTDLTLGGASLRENADRDAILPVERIEELRSLIAPDADLADPRLSSLFARYDGAPPVYLQASRAEILRDDTLRLADRLGEAGAQVTTDLWPDAPHVWHLFYRWIPEADDALNRVAGFARDRLRSLSRQSES